MRVKVEVTKTHLRRALRQYRETGFPVSQCCPVFQALKDADLDVEYVAYRSFAIYGGKVCNLPKVAEQITLLGSDEWNQIEPMSFTVNIPVSAMRKSA